MEGDGMLVRVLLAFLTLGCIGVPAQIPDSDGEIYSTGPGVKPPILTRKVDPKYSRHAIDANVQGTVVLEIVVNESGRIQEIVVLSPLGFGLDERAQEAIGQWTFSPGNKD